METGESELMNIIWVRSRGRPGGNRRGFDVGDGKEAGQSEAVQGDGVKGACESTATAPSTVVESTALALVVFLSRAGEEAEAVAVAVVVVAALLAASAELSAHLNAERSAKRT